MTVHNDAKLYNTSDTVYFTVDNELCYYNYYYDFGPLNISCLYKYCQKLNTYLETYPTKRIIYYTSMYPNTRANAACLIGPFAIIYLGYAPGEIYDILTRKTIPYRPFIDASQSGNSGYVLFLSDVLAAIYKARTYGFFNFDDFDVMEYDTYDMLRNGDLNWLLPRKFVAFIGPIDNGRHFGLKQGLNCHPASFYVHYFLKHDVRTVIRLNDKLYDETVFTKVGIIHYDMFFPDGSIPPKSVLIQFLHIAENSRGAIAVHCKAGLGRTGSLIGAYIVKHYHMTAREAISWLRICRPGSVIGQQQGWLEKMEKWLWHQGNNYRLKYFGAGDRIPHHKYGIYSIKWKEHQSAILRTEKLMKKHFANDELSSKLESHNWHTNLGIPPSILQTYNNIEDKFYLNNLNKNKNTDKYSPVSYLNYSKDSALKSNIQRNNTKSNNTIESVNQIKKENTVSKFVSPKATPLNSPTKQKDNMNNSKIQKRRIFSANDNNSKTPSTSKASSSSRRSNLIHSADNKIPKRTSTLKSTLTTNSRKLEEETRRQELLTKLQKYKGNENISSAFDTEKIGKQHSTKTRTQGDRLNEIKANHFS